MALLLRYAWQTDGDGNKLKAWIFTELDTACAQMDMQKALDDGTISQAYYNALTANKYGGDTPPQTEYWLDL